MRAGYGGTLQGVALTQGNIDVTSGTYKGAKTVECVVGGNITLTFTDGTTKTTTFVAGRANPVDCVSVTVVTGTWVIGYD